MKYVGSFQHFPEMGGKLPTLPTHFAPNDQIETRNAKILRTLKNWYFVTKIVLTYCEKNCSSDREKLLKFKAEGREFAKFLRSLEQFIQTVKGQNNFW